MSPPNSSPSSAESAPLLPKQDPVFKTATQDYGTADSPINAAAEAEATEDGTPVNGQPAEEGPVDPAIEKARSRIWIIVAALSLGTFLAMADASIVNANYGTISSSFGRLDLAPWVSTSYFLALGCTQTLYGKLSDIFGRKPCLMFAYTVFGLGSLLCGLAPTMQTFIAARVIQGLGGGGIGIVTTVLLSDIVTIRERATFQAYMNMIGALGIATGAPLGGLLAERIGWRWTFYGQVPLVLLGVLNLYLLLNLPAKDHTSWRQNLLRIDFSGAILLVTFIFCLLFGMDRGSRLSFTHPSAYTPLAAFPLLLALFLYNEVRFARNPFLPTHALTDRNVMLTFLGSFLFYGAYMALIFYIPLFFQAIDGVRSAQAGVLVLPASVVGIGGNVLGGYLLKRTGRYYVLFLLGNVLAAASMVVVIMGTVYPRHDLVLIQIGSICACFSFGVALSASLISLLANIHPPDQATLTALMFTLRYCGSAVAVSACGTLINHILKHNLHATLAQDPSVDADAIVSGVIESLEYIRRIEPESLRTTVRMAYSGAVGAGFVLVAGLWASAAFVVAWIRGRKMGV